MTQPLSEADILFPYLSNNPNFSSTLTSLRRSALSVHHRLKSIISDSDFVYSVAEAYDLPLVANERCGSWYIRPEKKTEGVYFKSTDGHTGEWGFSLRRLNLQLLDVVQNHEGAVVVDSTRRGKSMPDALSKTIPIWCCVINRSVFGTESEHAMYTPPQAVSSSEHAQISGRIDGFVRQFLDICKPSISELREKLRKPLRPIWVTQLSSLPESPPAFTDFYPIVLCTASRRVQGAEASEGGYIQGAADDHEAWSHGLTPPIFWKNKDLLMSTSEEDAPAVISKLLEEEAQTSIASMATLIKPTTKLYISSSQNVDLTGFDIVISCTPKAMPNSSLKASGIKHYLPLKCNAVGKLGSRDLRTELSLLAPFLTSLPSLSTDPKILVCCPTGKDLSVGTALAILCLFTSDTGAINLSNAKSGQEIDKNFIKQRLSWITMSNPALNPSRATLQSVNTVLLASQDPKTISIPIRSSRPVESEGNANDTVSTNDTTDSNSTAPPQLSSSSSSLQSTIFSHLPTTPWTFHRTLTSTLPTHPSGTVTGAATFTPCNLPSNFSRTLLYEETGEFVMENGLKATARRKYVYQLVTPEDSREGEIVMKFHADSDLPYAQQRTTGVGETGEGIGGVFVEMGQLSTSRKAVDGELVAENKEQHLCAQDLYSASWKFGKGMTTTTSGEGKGEKDVWWEVRYDVKGPKKDYVSWTRYEPSSWSKSWGCG